MLKPAEEKLVFQGANTGCYLKGYLSYGAKLNHLIMLQNVERSLLSDLILKLIPIIFLPGDIICRKGEVGTAMYIIMHGEVEVVDDDGGTLANLPKGHVFGEIRYAYWRCAKLILTYRLQKMVVNNCFLYSRYLV